MRYSVLLHVAVMATYCAANERCEPGNVPLDKAGDFEIGRATFAVNGTTVEDCAGLCTEIACAAYTCGLPEPDCLCILYCTQQAVYSHCAQRAGTCDHSTISEINTTRYSISQHEIDTDDNTNPHSTVYVVMIVFISVLLVFACYTSYDYKSKSDANSESLTRALVDEDRFDDTVVVVRETITPISPHLELKEFTPNDSTDPTAAVPPDTPAVASLDSDLSHITQFDKTLQDPYTQTDA